MDPQPISGGPGRFINLAKISPGDIIFSREFGWESGLFARFGGSPYSHASLAIDSQCLLEATTLKSSFWGRRVGGVRMVGFTPTIHFKRRENSAEEETFEVLSLKDMAYFDVYRYRSPDEDRFIRFQDSLLERFSDYSTRPYANAHLLARASVAPGLVKFFLRRLPILGRQVDRGFYCSMLVAQAYRDGGIQLIEDNSSKVTLGRLRASPHLKCVTDQLSFTPGPGDKKLPADSFVEECMKTMSDAQMAAWELRDGFENFRPVRALLRKVHGWRVSVNIAKRLAAMRKSL